MTTNTAGRIRLSSAAGRWILAGTVLGSGAVFLEGSVVSVALPAIGRGFHLDIAGLQWTMNGYLLTLSALMLFGGALGDRTSRSRVFGFGLVGFAIGSALCAIAPTPLFLVIARVLQGAAGALVVPNSLAILETTFAGEDRGLAIGKWAAWSAVSTAGGPLLGGWLVDFASWRWVFLSIVPVALASAWIVLEHSAPREAKVKSGSLDYAGAALATLSLGAIIGALITAPVSGFTSPLVLGGFFGGAVFLALFIVVEIRAPNPMLPLDAFRSREFIGANLNTLLVYGALNALFFLLMLQLQVGLGWSALIAGASLLPINFLLLMLSPSAGKVAERIGPRWPMTIGSFVAAAGMLLFARVGAGSTYLRDLLPAVIVFGTGLGILVSPLTAAALRALGDRRGGLASGVNNAVARLAGLLATAVIPMAAGIGGATRVNGPALASGFGRGMVISAVLCAAGGVAALSLVGGKIRKKER
ncbi:MAG: MFS transporter [Gemmatimonadota bacterium]|nr:MFS transporter [Gemmatimonadota bacterium]